MKNLQNINFSGVDLSDESKFELLKACAQLTSLTQINKGDLAIDSKFLQNEEYVVTLS